LLPEFLMLLRIWRFLRIGEFGQCIVNDILKVCAYVMEEHEAHIQTKLKMERDLQRVKKELNDLKNVDQIDENSPQDGVAKEKDATPKNQEDAAKGQQVFKQKIAEAKPPENWVTPPTEAQNGKADTSLIEKEKELKNV